MTQYLKLEEELRVLQRAVQELTILNEIAVAISTAMPSREIHELIIQKCVNHMDAEQGYISLFFNTDDSNEAKTYVRVAESSDDYFPIRLGITLSGWLAMGNSSLRVNDAQKDEHFSGMDFKGSLIRSVLAVPLRIQNRNIGFIALFNKKTGIFTESDERILTIIALQSAQVIETSRLYEEERALQLLRQELKAASVIQENLFPKSPPILPGYDIAGISIPAKEVGGDYFDFMDISPDIKGIVLGDVAGKGLPAALLMANLHATLRSQVLIGLPVEICIRNTNRLLSERMESGKFITLFYGELSNETHLFTYCNAGHNPPFLIRANGEVKKLKTSGIVIGILADVQYQVETVFFNPGDKLIIFSDGLIETQNAFREEFGEDRLIQILAQTSFLPSDEIIQKLLSQIREFRGRGSQSDDETVIIIQRPAL